jgi:SAM-dependent methyltransferase
MFGPQRHRNLAAALPVPPGGAVVDLGCGRGPTLAALADRHGDRVRLVGVELAPSPEADQRFAYVAADLNQTLPFADGAFEAAVCHNVIECLRSPESFMAEVARVLAPGGHLLLGHSDFDTLVFSTSDLALTRRLVHRFCDSVPPFMTEADGTIGRRLVALAHRSPLDLVETFAWVGHSTTFDEGGPAHTAATLVAAEGRGDPELAPRVDAWLADLERQAAAGELFYSVNDYAVLLRTAGET